MLVAVVRNNSIIVVEFAIKRCRGTPFLFDTHKRVAANWLKFWTSVEVGRV